MHLSDFGIAKNMTQGYRREETTSVGFISGTIEYLAPEILNAKVVKPDISK